MGDSFSNVRENGGVCPNGCAFHCGADFGCGICTGFDFGILTVLVSNIYVINKPGGVLCLYSGGFVSGNEWSSLFLSDFGFSADVFKSCISGILRFEGKL